MENDKKLQALLKSLKINKKIGPIYYHVLNAH